VFGVKQLLRISADVHKQVFREVQERVQSSEKDDREASPEEIYRLLVRRALEDGQLLSEENRLLDELARLLQIGPNRRREIEKKVTGEFSGKTN